MLVYVSILEGPAISVTQILCVLIGQRRPSRPMISLGSSPQLELWHQRHINQGLDFQRQYILLQNIVSMS